MIYVNHNFRCNFAGLAIVFFDKLCCADFLKNNERSYTEVFYYVKKEKEFFSFVIKLYADVNHRFT